MWFCCYKTVAKTHGSCPWVQSEYSITRMEWVKLTKQELERLLERRNEKIKRQKIEAKREAENAIEECKHEIRLLSPKMNEDIQMLVMLRNNGINAYYKFIADGIHHQFGLFDNKANNSIGIKGGGCCGDWDICYESTSQELMLQLHDKGKRFWDKDRLSLVPLPDTKSPWSIDYLPLIIKFIKGYKKFHEEFHEWLENNEELKA